MHAITSGGACWAIRALSPTPSKNPVPHPRALRAGGGGERGQAGQELDRPHHGPPPRMSRRPQRRLRRRLTVRDGRLPRRAPPPRRCAAGEGVGCAHAAPAVGERVGRRRRSSAPALRGSSGGAALPLIHSGQRRPLAAGGVPRRPQAAGRPGRRKPAHHLGQPIPVKHGRPKAQARGTPPLAGAGALRRTRRPVAARFGWRSAAQNNALFVCCGGDGPVCPVTR
jgi:hypothetical protein